MTHAYQLLTPRRPLASAYQATPAHLHPHGRDDVRFTFDAALHGVEWDASPGPGESLRGVYDGPGGRLELTLATGHPEVLLLRATAGQATARLVRSLCDRTGWTALDLQTLKLLPPRAPASFPLDE